MSTHLTLEKIVHKLPERFNPSQAVGFSAIYQFNITNAESFYLQVTESQCDAQFGSHTDPDITLIMDEATLIRVISGEQDGMSAFMKGQLRAEGNVMLAMRLGKLFKR